MRLADLKLNPDNRYGMELDPKYVDVIRKRYWKFTHDNNEEGWEDGTARVN